MYIRITMTSSQYIKAIVMVKILVIVSIIVILLGTGMLLIPKGNRIGSKITWVREDFANIGLALSMYEIKIGTYPSSDQGLRALVRNPGVEEWTQPFTDQKILRDPWGNEYQYTCPGDKAGLEYNLYSLGPDGLDGTKDDIWN